MLEHIQQKIATVKRWIAALDYDVEYYRGESNELEMDKSFARKEALENALALLESLERKARKGE